MGKGKGRERGKEKDGIRRGKNLKGGENERKKGEMREGKRKEEVGREGEEMKG